MLEVHNLTKSIDGKVILDRASFTLRRGTIAGLVGRNGSGKTTLLRCLVGVLLPDEGDVLYEGVNIYRRPEIKANMMYVPDGRHLHRNYTAQQVAGLYNLIYPNFAEERFFNWLDEFSLPRRRQLQTFSKGMYRLLTLALAFAAGTDLVLLDEPIDGLDPVAKRQSLQLIVDEVAARGVTVLISSHRLVELETIGDEIFMLTRGAVESPTILQDMQQHYCKLQIAYRQAEPPQALLAMPNVHLLARSGRIVTVLVEGTVEVAIAGIENTDPVLIDPLPLQLEDLFIAKLGGETHAG